MHENTTVSVYDKDGWVRDLPNLQIARRDHGCGHYYDNSNNPVSMLNDFLNRFYIFLSRCIW